MQVTVESCSSIGISPLLKAIKRVITKDYPESSIDEIYQFAQKELKRFTVNEQYFDYESIGNHLGGYRWFFLCPKCQKRSSKLFLPPVSVGREPKYLCKKCHRLKNQSAIQGQNNMYKKVTKPLKRLKEIENKIAKGHLKSEKVQELLDEYDKLEKGLKASPEFRLYTFKLKHKIL